MKQIYKTFCEQYLAKLESDKEIEKQKNSEFNPFRQTVPATFELRYYHARTPFLFIGGGEYSIVLDDEDLEYLYKKYSKLLTQELEQNIKELNEDYKKVIGE
jgi:predicted metal-dependent hydrolase